MDQNITKTAWVEQVGAEQLRPWWVIRCGRGRVGGSTPFLNFIIEWGRHRGRRVKPLDGDLRSRTLTALYPAEGPDGSNRDAAASPVSEELIDNKAWVTAELDASVEDGVCRGGRPP